MSKESDLMKAAEAGELDKVEALLGDGADVNHQDNEKFTALMHASAAGHTETVNLLVKHKADVNIAEKSGCTALIFAATQGHEQVVISLLSAGADVYRKGHRQTAEKWASGAGHTQIAKAIKKHSDNTDKLVSAAKTGKTKDVKGLLAEGADVNSRDRFGHNSVLILAALRGHTDVVKALLSNGADAKYKAKTGYSALIAAEQNSHDEVVKTIKNHLFLREVSVMAKENRSPDLHQANKLNEHLQGFDDSQIAEVLSSIQSPESCEPYDDRAQLEHVIHAAVKRLEKPSRGFSLFGSKKKNTALEKLAEQLDQHRIDKDIGNPPMGIGNEDL